MTLANAYVAIRDLHEDGGPTAPEAWSRSVQGSTGWTMIEHPNGLLAAYLVDIVPGPPNQDGLFAFFGPQALLDTIAGAMPAREMFRRRSEPAVGRMMRAWPVWRVDDDGENEVRRRLIPRATGLPTVSVPWGTVTRLYHPALDATLAGRSLHLTLEDEPDRGV